MLNYRYLEETYWQDIPYSLTELKRVGRKQVQQNKAMEEYHSKLFDKIRTISNELLDERNARELLEEKASFLYFYYILYFFDI